MRSDVIPPIGSHLTVRAAKGLRLVSGDMRDSGWGAAVELRSLEPGRVNQQVGPAPTLELPPAA